MSGGEERIRIIDFFFGGIIFAGGPQYVPPAKIIFFQADNLRGPPAKINVFLQADLLSGPPEKIDFHRRTLSSTPGLHFPRRSFSSEGQIRLEK